MAISLSVRTAFARNVYDKPHRRRRQRRALAVVVLLVAAILGLLLLRFANHSPHRTPTAVPRPNAPATKVGAPVTGLPGVICTGRQRTIARTPTKADLRRLKRNAPKVLKQAATGKAPKMPTEITGRRLPDGAFSGSCHYGPQTPATTAPGSNY